MLKTSFNQLELKTIAVETKRCFHTGCDGFIYWCEKYARIPDLSMRTSVQAKLYDSQKYIAKALFSGQWIVVLKARQLGVTTVIDLYVVWNLIRQRMWVVSVLNQNEEYAIEFLDKTRGIISGLPLWMQPKKASDTKRKLVWRQGSRVRTLKSIAASKKAGRSMTGNLIIFDEAAFIDYFKESKQAIEPTAERGGQIVVVSTSDGPVGEFFNLYQSAKEGKSRYEPVFFPWHAHPERNEAWYQARCDENREEHNPEQIPLVVKREYPATEEEAWDSPKGRCFPSFSRETHLLTIQDIGHNDILPEWDHYRAIDWGGADPFVCLFACVIPGEIGFSIDPSCTHSIADFIAWRRDDHTGQPLNKNKHACDALRYMCTTYELNGHLHVYREIYIPNHAEKGIDLVMLAKMVKEEIPDMEFSGTCADRSSPSAIKLFSNHGILTRPYKKASRKGGRNPEIESGIRKVNVFMVGSNQWSKQVEEDKKLTNVERWNEMRGQFGGNLKTKELFEKKLFEMQNGTKEEVLHPMLGYYY